MDKSINLVPQKTYQEKKSNLINYVVDILTAFAILILAVIALIIVNIDYSKSQDAKSLTKQVTTLQSNISTYNSISQQLVIVQKLIEQYNLINKSNSSQSTILDNINAVRPSDVSITTYTYKNGVISLTASSNNYLSLVSFIESLSEKNPNNKHASTLSVGTIIVDSYGITNVVLSFNYI